MWKTLSNFSNGVKKAVHEELGTFPLLFIGFYSITFFIAAFFPTTFEHKIVSLLFIGTITLSTVGLYALGSFIDRGKS